MIEINSLKQKVYDVVRAIYDVHGELGPGLNESCYQEGLQIELKEKGIPYVREMSFHPNIVEFLWRLYFDVDFICKDDIMIECKAVSRYNRQPSRSIVQLYETY